MLERDGCVLYWYINGATCNYQSIYLKHHTSVKIIINMTVLDISKLGFYVLLSVAFAQILVVGAAENTDDVNGVTSVNHF
ncbi:hypothetical protein C8R48DRAFT_762408 [Suillus tomentosus]|nr:hypothetical protein C8R48DRAFT_762408 [Suillus tomentosus]